MASVTPPTDPRVAARAAAEPPPEDGVRPVVAMPRGGLSPLVIAIGIAVAAILLFLVLNARRQTLSQPSVTARGAATLPTAPPPVLYIPPVPAPPPPVVAVAPPPPPQPLRVVTAPPRPVPPPPPPVYIQQPAYQAPPAPVRTSNSPTLVIDTTSAPPVAASAVVAAQAASDAQSLGGTQGGGRVRASVFANRGSTVAQGTLIPAVLETAFDSTRPGFARAVVSRDVRGFDGSHILIPRGSRLTGEYRSDIQPGQKRALINWTRLIRPDGITVALASPATDTLGRGGVSGHYNGHFWERFAGAILQSALDVGVNIASRAASPNVVVALPGSTQTLSPALLQSARIVPTVTVPAGTSISVFVAHDLDFSGTGKGQ
ncbi:MAG TPA: TrbI/VirB10 family protein [Allosphingosinicella sp.]|nr:TrbI/VirB10 family protein [Allosphingosinicella sp.]